MGSLKPEAVVIFVVLEGTNSNSACLANVTRGEEVPLLLGWSSAPHPTTEPAYGIWNDYSQTENCNDCSYRSEFPRAEDQKCYLSPL